jgi:hypothetical protein
VDAEAWFSCWRAANTSATSYSRGRACCAGDALGPSCRRGELHPSRPRWWADRGGWTRFHTATGEQETLVVEHPDAAGPALLAGSFAEVELLGGSWLDGGFDGDPAIWQRGVMQAGGHPRSMDVIKELMATTQRYVKDNRLAIRTVAQALEAAGSLTGDQVDALLGVSR